MTNSQKIAEQATIQSFLNCYIRETGNMECIDRDFTAEEIDITTRTGVNQLIQISLTNQSVQFIVPVRYLSPTGRHSFEFPVFYKSEKQDNYQSLDYVTMVSLLTKELSLASASDSSSEELMLRTILSKQKMEQFIEARTGDGDRLFGPSPSFIEAEQSLVFGHMLHPTPKSRQGIPEEEASHYAPELKGSFPLHYFRADASIVREGSSREQWASDFIKDELIKDPEIDKTFKQQYCARDSYVLIPIHPLQVQFLLKDPKVKKRMEEGTLEYLGAQGQKYQPTSSVRTVYHQDSPFMYKFSLNVKITNSLRKNQVKELERGLEVSRLLDGEIGKVLSSRFEGFEIIHDPAYITLSGDLEDLGFEVSLRENPFYQRNGEQTTLLAGLCQDNLYGGQSRLATIINDVAEKEQRSTKEVSVDWFQKYLDKAVKPVFWLFFNYGIAVEAHQQNSVLRLKNGYPDHFYYRDNQGYYFCRSTANQLRGIVPGLNEKSDTICEDEVAVERLRYYFVFNNVLGLINAFGTAGLIDEQTLLEAFRNTLVEMRSNQVWSSAILDSLLDEEQLPCKANLLTRLYDMDELVGALETQSVYVHVDNPLAKEAAVIDA